MVGVGDGDGVGVGPVVVVGIVVGGTGRGTDEVGVGGSLGGTGGIAGRGTGAVGVGSSLGGTAGVGFGGAGVVAGAVVVGAVGAVVVIESSEAEETDVARIKFTVYGKAQPAGSKTGFPVKRKDGTLGVAMSDSNPKAKSWQQEVKAAAADAHDGWLLLTGPIGLRLIVYMVRPKGHFGTGRNAKKLKKSAPAFPTVKPDLLKLARGIEDALTGIVYRDDSQIVEEELLKRYSDRAACHVTVYDLQAIRRVPAGEVNDVRNQEPFYV